MKVHGKKVRSAIYLPTDQIPLPTDKFPKPTWQFIQKRIL
jgi:hypothetical protein